MGKINIIILENKLNAINKFHNINNIAKELGLDDNRKYMVIAQLKKLGFGIYRTDTGRYFLEKNWKKKLQEIKERKNKGAK